MNVLFDKLISEHTGSTSEQLVGSMARWPKELFVAVDLRQFFFIYKFRLPWLKGKLKKK